MGERYAIVEDPCGLFYIWDESLLEPAMMGDDILAFLRRDSAGRIARLLNARANDDVARRAIHLAGDAMRAGTQAALR